MGETVKKRTTKKQTKANRANAEKSTGPRTVQGKARVRLNAVKHGLRAEHVVVLGGPTAEDPAEFDSLLSGMLDDCKPAGVLERVLVERLAVSYWRLRRAYRFEARAIEEVNKPNPVSKMLEELSQLPPHDPGLQELPGLRSLDKLVRYEMMIDRELLRTAAQLQHLQRVRKLEEEDAVPEPGPSGSGPSADQHGGGSANRSGPQPEGCGSANRRGPQPEGCGSIVKGQTRAPLKSGGTPAGVAAGASAGRSPIVERRPTRGSAATARNRVAWASTLARGQSGPSSTRASVLAHATQPLQHGRHGRGTRDPLITQADKPPVAPRRQTPPNLSGRTKPFGRNAEARTGLRVGRYPPRAVRRHSGGGGEARWGGYDIPPINLIRDPREEP